jgi:hypothetical protein
MMHVFTYSKFQAFIEYADDKEWESENHNYRETDIDERMKSSIISEHNSNISKIPPYSASEEYKNDVGDTQSRVMKWLYYIL